MTTFGAETGEHCCANTYLLVEGGPKLPRMRENVASFAERDVSQVAYPADYSSCDDVLEHEISPIRNFRRVKVPKQHAFLEPYSATRLPP